MINVWKSLPLNLGMPHSKTSSHLFTKLCAFLNFLWLLCISDFTYFPYLSFPSFLFLISCSPLPLPLPFLPELPEICMYSSSDPQPNFHCFHLRSLRKFYTVLHYFYLCLWSITSLWVLWEGAPHITYAYLKN